MILQTHSHQRADDAGAKVVPDFGRQDSSRSMDAIDFRITRTLCHTLGRPKSRTTLLSLVAAVLLAGNHEAAAAESTLSGSGGATLPGLAWGAAGNWSPAVLPGVNDHAVIAATGLVDVRGSAFGGAAEIQDLTFTGANGVTLHNNSSGTAMLLALNGGRGAAVPLISTIGDVARTISGPGTSATPQTLGLQLRASGMVNVSANVLSISACISEIGGARQLTKTGAGTLVLSGRNTYSGGTVVNAGVLELSGASGGNGRVDGAVTVAAGAELRITEGDGTGLGFKDGSKVDSLTVNGGLVSAVATSHVWNATVTMTGGELRSKGDSYFEWGNSTLTTNASAASAVISGRVNIRRDVNAFLTLDVADGPAAVDLLVSAALTQSGGKCGLVKRGNGTLRLTGAVNLDGVITVEVGSLDVSTASLGANVQFNLSNRAFLKLPPTSAHKVFVAGEKLAAGTWGPPGSVLAGKAANEHFIFTGSPVVKLTNTEPSARERWRGSPYGLLVHYVFEGGQVTRQMDGKPSPNLDYVANGFDAKGFADDVASMGVDYVIFTAWHSNFIPLFNSSAVVKNFGFQRNASRDMIGEMVAAVKAKGIRVLLYANIGQVSVHYDGRWNNMMEDIFAEMMERYDIDGFFMDENDPGGNMSWDFHRVAQAIYRRKPDAVTVQNFYGNLYTWDGAVGESGSATPNFSNDIMWTAPSPFAQVISNTWSAVVPKIPTPQKAVTRSAEGIYRGTVVAAGSRTEGGGIMWSAGPFPGDGTWLNPATNQKEFVGRWEVGVLEAMQGAGDYIAPIAESIKGTRPSTSWNPQGFVSNLEWGVATRRPDDSREYIHVLKPQPTSTLKLPPPHDGKVFANARLLPSKKPVRLEQDGFSVRLTLPPGETWNPLNTVIAMDVVRKGGFASRIVPATDPAVVFGAREVFNNTATKQEGAGWIEYHGNWSHQHRDGGEFQSDIHWCGGNGEAFTIHFDGTGVMMVGNGLGEIDFALDGKPVKRVNMNASGNRPGVVGIDLTGLPKGKHKLKGTKVGGPYVQVDMFRIYNPAGGKWKPAGPNNTLRSTERSEDFVQFDFTGTAVQFLAPQGPGGATIEVFLDGESVRHVNQYHPMPLGTAPLFTLNGLPAGRHTLCLVKKRGAWMGVEAFRVFNPAK